MAVDLEKIEKLLNVADFVKDHPNLAPVFEWVLRELAAVNKEALAEVEAAKQKEKEEQEKAAAEQKEKADAEGHSEGVRAGDSEATGTEGGVRRRYP